VEGFIEN
jgi:hypothetical protein